MQIQCDTRTQYLEIWLQATGLSTPLGAGGFFIDKQYNDKPEPHYWLGRLRYQDGKVEQAIGEFRRRSG